MKGAVAYTDGSARPTNPGHVGWGVHGFIYTESPENKPYTYDNNYLTPGSYIPVADKKKVKQFVKPVEFFDCVGGLELLGSQNVGELTAIIKILEKLLEYELEVVQILTDAKYVRDGFCDWMETWQKQLWKKRDGSPVANIPLWERLIQLKRAYQDRTPNDQVKLLRLHNANLQPNRTK